MIPKDVAKKQVDSLKARTGTTTFFNRLLEAPDLEQFIKITRMKCKCHPFANT